MLHPGEGFTARRSRQRRAGRRALCTDSKAAYDLCHRYSAAQHTKHIDRKMFKMRELRGAGCVTMRHLPGEKNPADLFTKVLCRQDFEKHRAFVLNTKPEDSFTVDVARDAPK